MKKICWFFIAYAFQKKWLHFKRVNHGDAAYIDLFYNQSLVYGNSVSVNNNGVISYVGGCSNFKEKLP